MDQLVKRVFHDSVHCLFAGSVASGASCSRIENEHARAKEAAMDEVGSPLISALKVSFSSAQLRTALKNATG